ncbi:MAG: hypothetical protein RIT27_1718 [Pseudomonadota bacterium]|jgi:hypothetical protein
MRILFLLAFLLSVETQAAVQVTANSNAAVLVQKLLNDPTACTTGSSVSNCTYSGASEAAGLFSNGKTSGFDLDDGIVLSTGKISDMPAQNLSNGKTTNFNTVGDTDLETLTIGGTRDAATLSFDFVAQGEILTFQYIFASEEYNEFVNSEFNDVFGFFLNNTATPNVKNNIGTLNGQTVSINTVNKSSNTTYFVNNDYKDFENQIAPFTTEYDGFTRLIQAKNPLVAGQTYHLKLAIADVGDSGFDSAILLKGFATIPPIIEISENNVVLNNSSTLDFGTTSEGNPITKNVIIKNTATSPKAAALNISNVAFPAGFSTTTTFPIDIPPNGQLSIPVRFDALAAGAYQGMLFLGNNSQNNQSVTLNLVGNVTGLTPQLSVTVNNLPLIHEVSFIDFGVTTVGSRVSKMLTLANTGNAPILLNIIEIPPNFDASNMPSNLAAGATVNVPIYFNSNQIGTYNGRITLTSNSPQSPLRFFVGGTVEPAPVVENSTASVPTLSEWAMILLSFLLFLLGAREIKLFRVN